MSDALSKAKLGSHPSLRVKQAAQLEGCRLGEPSVATEPVPIFDCQLSLKCKFAGPSTPA